MRIKTPFLFTSILGSLFIGNSVQAKDFTVYLQGNIGGNFIVRNDLNGREDGFEDIEGDYETSNGLSGGAAVGMDFGNGFRGEVEYTYRQNDLDTFTAEGFTFETASEVKSDAFMLNGYYDFDDNASSFVPYLGAGIGYVNATIDAGDLEEEEGAFAYQLKAGVARYLWNSTKDQLGAEVIYFDTKNIEFSDGDATLETEYGNISVQAYYRRRL